jgi:hypothetical protein
MTLNVNPKRVPGHSTCITPAGQKIEVGGDCVSKTSNTFSVAPETITEGSVTPLRWAAAKLSFLQDNQRAYDFGVPLSSRTPSIFSPSIKPDAQSSYAIGFDNREIYKVAVEKALSDLQSAEAETARNKDLNTCIEENVRALRSTAAVRVNDFLKRIVDLGIGIALNEINDQLPEFAQLNVDYDPVTNSLRGLSVGGVNYDVAEGSVVIDSSVYSTLVNEGLDPLNQALPPGLGFTANDFGLSANNITIRYEALTNPDGTPATPQQVAEGVTVSADQNKTVRVNFANRVFEVGKLTSAVTGRVFRLGTNAANQVLPDFLQIRGTPALTITDGQFSFTNSALEIGPVGYNFETKSLSLDTTSIGNDMANYLTELIDIDSLSAPLGSLAQIIWRAIDPAKLIADFLRGVTDPAGVAADRKETYTRIKNACEAEYKPGTPRTNYLDVTPITGTTDEGFTNPGPPIPPDVA